MFQTFYPFDPEPQRVPAKSSTKQEAKMCTEATKMFDAVQSFLSVAGKELAKDSSHRGSHTLRSCLDAH